MGIFFNEGGFIELYRRAIFSLIFVWLGFHGIGLGMIANGSNHPRNPVWQFLMGLFEIEVLVVKIVLCFVGLFILVTVIRKVFAFFNEQEEQKFEATCSSEIETTVVKTENLSPTVKAIESVKTESVVVTLKKPESKIKEKSAEELNKRLLNKF